MTPLSGEPTQPRWRTTAGLAGLLWAALAVRLVHLDTDAIWYDEAATIGIAAMDWRLILGPIAALESSPPGYYLAAKLWSALWDDSIWWFRMLSVLAGVGAIIPVFILARAAFGAPAAWIAGAFIALAGSHVRLSQDARCYALLFLVIASAMLAAARLAGAVSQPDRRKGGLVAALALGTLMGISLWLHATAALIVVSLNLFAVVLLAHDRASLRRGLLLLAVANLLMLAIAAWPLSAIVTHIGAADGYIDRWIAPPGIVDTARLYGRTLVAPFLYTLSPLALGLHMLLVGAAVLAWWRRPTAMLLALAVMLAASLLLLPLASQFRPVLLDRTALFMLLPLALLMGAGAAALPRTALIPMVAAVLLLQALGVERWHNWPIRKERWDQAAEVLKAHMLPGEPVVLADSSFVSISLARHLAGAGSAVPRMIAVPPDSAMEQFVARHMMPDFLPDAGELCRQLADGVAGLWLVLRELPEAIAMDNGFTTRLAVRAALLQSGATLRQTWRRPGIELQYWIAPRC